MDKPRELWRVDNLSDDDQKKYLKHLDNLHYRASMEWTLKVEAEDRVEKRGILKGIDQGIEQENKRMAKGLKEKIVYTKTIIAVTGLTKAEIDKL